MELLLVSLVILTTLKLTVDRTVRSSTVPAPANEQLRVSFVGDTAWGENYQGTLARLQRRGYDYPLQRVEPLLQRSDFVIANLETPLTDRQKSPEDKQYVHWTQPNRTVRVFNQHNITAFSLANNHLMDFGESGLERTLSVIKKNELRWFGAGKDKQRAREPLIKTFNTSSGRFKLAVLGAFSYRQRYDENYDVYANKSHPGVWELAIGDMKRSISRIRQAHPQAYIVIYPHWGSNYEWCSNRQRHYGHSLIDVGADLVIGHGAHCLQEVEKYKGKWIIYNLGNFVFLSPGRYKSENAPPFSFYAQLIISKIKQRRGHWLRLYPIHTNNRENGYQPYPVNANQFTRLKSRFYARCKRLSPATIRQLHVDQNQIGPYFELYLG